MVDEDKTKALLVNELKELHQKNRELEYRLESALNPKEKQGNQTLSGELLKIEGFTTDITERKKAEETLKMHALVLKNMAEGVVLVRVCDSVIVYTNPRFEELFGYGPNEMVGKHVSLLNAPTDKSPEETAKEIIKSLNKMGRWNEEVKNIKKDGTPFWCNASVNTFEHARHGLVWIAVHEDITKRKEAEEKIHYERDKLIRILDSMEDGVYVVNQKYDIEYINPVLAKEFGPVQGRKCYEYFNDRKEICPSCQNQDVFKNKNIRWEWYSSKNQKTYDQMGTFIKNQDGSISKVEIFRDITEQKQLEAQLCQVKKMEAIGTLAGGIAHDFNNILTPIMGHAEILKRIVGKDKNIHDSLNQILKSANRAKDLISHILTFSRQTKQEFLKLQLASVVREVLKLLRATIPATIKIRQNIDENSGVVIADPAQMHQIIMNLCTNAMHAMREKGGILEVTLESVHVDANFAADHTSLKEGPYLKLTVRDTGYGIKKEIIEQIFDPFFTTKEVGKGTGMGLATVHGVVINHNGEIIVNSEPGKGTTFEIFLPSVESYEMVKEQQPLPLLRGNERILLVDDEVDITKVVQLMLEGLGYKVVSKNNSFGALETFKNDPEKFDLVITDQTMPNMTGDKLATEMLKIRKDLPVILCTGHSEKITRKEALDIGIEEFQMKPYGVEDFGRKISHVLDRTIRKKTNIKREVFKTISIGSKGNIPDALELKVETSPRVKAKIFGNKYLVNIEGDAYLTESDKNQLLDYYAKAKKEGKKLKVNCTGKVESNLKKVGFDKFLTINR